MPCTSIHDESPIAIDTWLMDSGSSLDLLDKKEVKTCEELVRPCDPVLLDTANGERKADVAIDLYVGRLEVEIAPSGVKGYPQRAVYG